MFDVFHRDADEPKPSRELRPHQLHDTYRTTVRGDIVSVESFGSVHMRFSSSSECSVVSSFVAARHRILRISVC